VQNPNLGAALALLLGAGAAALTAWQQAVVAGVFELCLVGVMVIYELLGHVKQPRASVAEACDATYSATPIKMRPDANVPAVRPKALAAPQKAMVISIKALVMDRLFPGVGERTEIKALMRDYRGWCAERGCTPLELSGFLDEIEKICRKAGVAIEVGDDQRVYCIGVKLGNGQAAVVH
jgi:hypothetical protein